jgi:hypothetical protein
MISGGATVVNDRYVYHPAFRNMAAAHAARRTA